MLLQANDYRWLARARGRASCRSAARTSGATCSPGVDLIRRRPGAPVHALAWPLLTAADGTKLGKTTGARIWLDPAADQPVPVLPALDAHRRPPGRASSWLQFTLLPVTRSTALVAGPRRGAPSGARPSGAWPGRSPTLVHGARRPRGRGGGRPTCCSAATLDARSAEALETVAAEVPTTDAARPSSTAARPGRPARRTPGLAASKGEARRLVAQGGATSTASGSPRRTAARAGRPAPRPLVLLRRGKRQPPPVVDVRSRLTTPRGRARVAWPSASESRTVLSPPCSRDQSVPPLAGSNTPQAATVCRLAPASGAALLENGRADETMPAARAVLDRPASGLNVTQAQCGRPDDDAFGDVRARMRLHGQQNNRLVVWCQSPRGSGRVLALRSDRRSTSVRRSRSRWRV